MSSEIRHALMFRTGFYGNILQLVECTEQPDKIATQLNDLLAGLQLSAEDFYELETQAFEWGNNISTNIGHVSVKAKQDVGMSDVAE